MRGFIKTRIGRNGFLLSEEFKFVIKKITV